MKPKDAVKPHGTGCTATIEVVPGASKSEFTGVNMWRGAIQVRVAAQARDGAANEELVRFLAVTFGISKNDVIIMRGERSSMKVVYLPLAVEKAVAAMEVK